MLIAVSLALATVPARGVAQSGAVLELRRLNGAVVLDGRSDEPAWADVPPLPMTMYYPTFGGTPSERTEIRVAYDDEYLYASGRFYDSDPGGIRINSLYRDRWNGDDAFAIYVDAFNDNQNAKWFGTTPSAMRFDVLVSNDGATLNESWDAFWDAETVVTDEGWFAEVRIPFSTLGFQVGDDGRAVMGLTVTRLVSRTGERVTFPSIDPQFAFRQPSVAHDVSLSGVDAGRPVYVTPYALSGIQRQAVADTLGFVHEREIQRDVGLDVRYALASNLTLDLTVNTDFAQVEADDEQVNLDRFSLFFPEKRRFFQEQSGVFDFQLGNGTRVFHSRRIGLTDRAEPVPVLVGARMVGRVGEWDMGILNMQTDDYGALPSENFGTVRLRRRVLNDFSTVGGIVTTRTRSGAWNVAAGLDGSFRVFGDNYLTAKWAATADRDAALDPIESAQVYLTWQQRANRGLSYQFSVTHSGPDFRPELGFLPRSDFHRIAAYGNYFIFTDDHPYFRRIFPGYLAFSTFRNTDGALESGQYAVWVQWETKAGGGGWLEPKLFVEDVLTPFAIGGEIGIPAGRYTFADFQAVWSMPDGRRLRTSIDARAGTYFDGKRVQVVARPTWNVSSHFELGMDYQWTWLRFGERRYAAPPGAPAGLYGEGSTHIQVGRLRLRTALNSRASGNAFIQYNSTTDRVDLNLRLRYNFSEGQDLWLVFNEGLATETLPDPAQPELPRSLNRTFIVKYTHTLGG
jgi:hypothetical protein